MTEGFIPLSKCMPFWPAELLGDAPALDLIGVSNYEMTYVEEQEISFDMDLMYLEEIELNLPGLQALSFLFQNSSGATTVPLRLEMFPEKYLEIPNLSLTARLKSDLLQAYHEEKGEWVPSFLANGDPRPAEFQFDGVAVKFDFDHGVDINLPGGGAPVINVDPVGIGDTGIVIEMTNVQPYLNGEGTPPVGQADGFKGLFIESAAIHLPSGLSSIVPSGIEFENCTIGTAGFSGSLAMDWNPAPFQGEFFGREFELTSLAIQIEQNSLAEFVISGNMVVPYFDETIEVEIGIDLDGGITIGLANENGLVVLSKPNVLEFTISTLSMDIEAGKLKLAMSGFLQPLFGDPSNLSWPQFEVQELSIDSDGNVNLEGGWLNFPDQYTLDFYGFQLEITKLGFGRNEDGSKWLGFSGGLKLVEGIQAGASVEGLRITWFEGSLNEAKISFEGVGVEFEVPNVVRFKGFVSFREFEQELAGGGTEMVRRFDGEIKLELVALNFELDAKLVVGTADGDEGRYRFFAIFLGVELPVGIPLWTTGLALYGMSGLFSWKMEPNKLPDEVWYGIGEGEGYYHRPEVGVTDLKNKWINRPGSLGLGAGVTIGTLPDNGFLFSSKLLFAIVFPGPIILFEGKANFLKERSKLDEDPVFRSLMVLDAREGTMNFGLDMEYNFAKKGELVEIGGGAEAFFNFLDPMAWHLYLGEKEPRENRIRARVFQLFESNAYFMADAYKLQFGNWIGYDADWKFGPLGLRLEAWMEQNAVVSRDPVYLYGDIMARGAVTLSVFRFQVGCHIEAKLAAQVFDPFFIEGHFSAGINLPWPLKDFEVTVDLNWGPRLGVPEVAQPLKEMTLDHQKVSSSWTSKLVSGTVASNELYPNGLLEDDCPVVPLDARPSLTFNKSVHDVKKYGIHAPQIQPDFEVIGDTEKGEGPMEVKYNLDRILFQRWNGSQYQTVASNDEIYGSWAAMPQMEAGDAGGEPPLAATKLWLYVKNPFAYTRQISQMWEDWVEETYQNYPCPPPLADVEKCYDFEYLEAGEVLEGLVYKHPLKPGFRIVRLFPQLLSPSIFAAPIQGYTKGLNFRSMNPEPWAMQNPPSVNQVDLALDDSVRRVDVLLNSTDGISVSAKDVAGVVLSSDFAAVGVRTLSFSQPGNEIRGLSFFAASGSYTIISVCIWVAPSQAETDAYQEQLVHLQTEMGRWEDEGAVLLPFSNYRLAVKTSYETKGLGSYAGDANFDQSETFDDYLYFRTEGPPGLASLSAANNPASLESGEDSDLALESLELYVKQTIPASIPIVGEKPVLPKPVYRGYDIGFEFNEAYVDLMYLLAGRDLSIHLFDSNGRPVRDPNGRLIVLANLWGTAGSASLSQSSLRYIKMLQDASCTLFDEGIIPGDSSLAAIHKYLVLEPDSLYEARLVPMLFKDAFMEDNGQWQVVDEGTSGGASDWQRQGHGKIEGKGGSASENVFSIDENPDLSGLDTDFDQVVFSNDSQRPNKTYRILAVDEVAKELTLDGNPNLSTTDGKWEILPLGAMLQLNNTYSSPLSGVNPVKPGTMLILGAKTELTANHSEQPENWTDIRLTAVMRSSDDDAIGLVFRYLENNGQRSYYRFSMDRQRAYRRLVRVEDGVHVVLAEDDFTYTMEIDYEISIEAIGEEIRVFQNGELVFEVEDSRLSRGTFGMYAWANQGLRVSELQVEDFSKEAMIAYKFEFTSSVFQNFYHQLHSFQDESWAVETEVDFSDARLDSQIPSVETSEGEYRAYNALEEQLSVGLVELNDVQVDRLIQNGNTIAFWLKSQEPLIWSRLGWDCWSAKIPITDKKSPEWAKLTKLQLGDGILNQEQVDVLLRKQGSVDGLEIQYPVFDGLSFTQKVKNGLKPGHKIIGFLFRDDFADADLSDWTFVDEGNLYGPSQWVLDGGTLVQESNILNNVPRSALQKRGAIASAGDMAWQDLLFKTSMSSSDNDEVGMLFRFTDADNHYRFVIDRQISTRRLIKVEAGTFTLLWQDNFQYSQNTDYEMAVRLEGDRIQVYQAGVLVCDQRDSTHEVGQIGLHCWANAGARFSNVKVMPLSSLQDLAFHLDSFDTPFDLNWEVVDEGTQSAPSNWQNSEDGLVQLSNILSAGASRLGTNLLSKKEFAGDFRLTTVMETSDNDGMGIIFRYQDAQNYYRFSINAQASNRQLGKFTNGTFSILWEDSTAFDTAHGQVLTMDLAGDLISGYHNGVKLFDLHDEDHQKGKIGLYSWANTGLKVRELKLEQADWLTWYEFEEEGQFADGSHFRVYAGKFSEAHEEDVNLEQHFKTLWDGTGSLTFAGNSQSLRLVDKNEKPLHQMTFLDENILSNVGIQVLRKRDGTGVFIFRDGGDFGSGVHRLDFVFNRDNQASEPESQVWSQTGDQGPEVGSIFID